MPDFGGLNILTAAVFVGALVTFGSVALLLGVTTGEHATRWRRRFDRAAGRAVPVSQRTNQASSLRRQPIEGRFKTLERALRGALPGRQALAARLARTGWNISLSSYVMSCFGVAAVAALGVRVGFMLPWATCLLPGAAVGVVLPHLVIGRLAARRTNKFLQDLPEAIDVMVRGLKSGLPVMESISNVGEDFEDPIGTEFRSIADKVRIGGTLEEALWDVATRLAIPEFNFLAISVGVQRETGGNLTETLQNLADILRKRHQMKLKVKALSSEARASAYIIGALPFIMAVGLYAMNPDYMSTLFTDPRGHWMIAGGLTSELLGVAVMAKMVRFEI